MENGAFDWQVVRIIQTGGMMGVNQMAVAHSRKWRLVCLLLIMLGMVCSGYLLSRSFAVLGGKHPGSIDVCVAVFGTSCDETIQQGQPWKGGMPPAGWGVVFYVTLAALLILGWTLGDAFAFEASLAALTLCAFGALAGVGLMAVEWLGRGTPICPLCLIVHMLNLALVVAFKRLTGLSLRELARSLKDAGKYVLGAEALEPHVAAWKSVGLFCGVLVAVVAYQWVYVEVSLRRAAALKPRTPAQIVAEYDSIPRQEVPIDADDARRGPLDAPVQLVVFSSFQCPACQQMAQQIGPLCDRFSNSLVIVFKHYPLETSCNPHVEFDQHPLACDAAAVAEGARQSGRFWKLHDAIFAAQPLKSAESIDDAIETAGLGVTALHHVAESVSVTSQVQADIALGKRLGVDATPALFMNGRRLTEISPTTIVALIEHELAQAWLREDRKRIAP